MTANKPGPISSSRMGSHQVFPPITTASQESDRASAEDKARAYVEALQSERENKLRSGHAEAIKRDLPGIEAELDRARRELEKIRKEDSKP